MPFDFNTGPGERSEGELLSPMFTRPCIQSVARVKYQAFYATDVMHSDQVSIPSLRENIPANVCPMVIFRMIFAYG